MKKWYDRNATERRFEVGNEVLVLLSLQGQSLSDRFCGPYVIERRIGATHYRLRTPDHSKKYQLCHIIMLKLYHRNESSPTPAPVVRTAGFVTPVEDVDVKCGFLNCR